MNQDQAAGGVNDGLTLNEAPEFMLLL